LSVVLCVVRAVHKCVFRLVTNETPNKCRLVFKKKTHAVIEAHVFGGISMSSPYRCHDCYGTLPTLCRPTAFS
jgi:hypothetical protein